MTDDTVVWDDSYSLGIPAIDDQHKILVVMINDIFQSCNDESVSEKVVFSRACRKAAEYAATHFHDEEALLTKAGYPNFPEHKKEHESFMAEVWAEFNKFEKSGGTPVGLARFLKKWLLNHIVVKDKQYVPYVAKL
jgi:hemerythrin